MSLSVFELKPNMFLDPRFRGKQPLNPFEQDVYGGFFKQTGTRDGILAVKYSVPENFLQLVGDKVLATKYPSTIKNQRISQGQM